MARRHALVAAGHAANPDPSACRKRDYLQRRSHNPAVAFATHKTAILRYMRDLDVAFTNNQADVTCGP